MKFVYPAIGLIILGICIGLIQILLFSKKKKNRLRSTWGYVIQPKMAFSTKVRVFFQAISLVIATICLCIAISRPQWGFTLEKREHIGVNIMFAVDVSKSMLAEDVRPNRLELAKMSILELLKSLAGNHVGLIAFAGNAFLQCPSTADIGAFKASLRILDVNSINRGGTDISSAMKLASRLFEYKAKYKQVLLLTDGENLSGDTIKTAKMLGDQGIVVHTIGIGTPKGSPISIKNDNGISVYVKDQNGKIIITKLDETTLRTIAQKTHGFYAPLGNAGEGLQTIYNMALKSLPKESFESLEKAPIERYSWFVAIALLLFALEPLIYSFRSLKRL